MTIPARRTLALLAVLLLLGLVRIAMRIVGDRQDTVIPSPYAALDIPAVTSVTLRHGDERLELVRAEGAWTMKDPADDADPLQVQQLLEQLRSLDVRRIAAEDTRDLAAFGLTDDRGMRIVVRAGEVVRADLRVASDAGRTYLRDEREQRVLEVAGTFPEHATADAWRSRQVLSIDPAAIREVELRGETETVVLRREEAAFRLQRRDTMSAVPRPSGEAFLATLANLRATGFPDGAAASGTVLTVIVRADGRPDLELKIGGATATGDRIAFSNRRPVAMALSPLDVRALEEPDFTD